MSVQQMFEGYSLTSGAVRYRDLAYLIGIDTAAQEAGRIQSRIFIHDRGQWLPPVDLDWAARSCSICQLPEERLVAMSEEGYIVALGGGRVTIEPRIAPGKDMRGPLTEVRGIEGLAFAVGTLRQAYVREAAGRWRRIDQTCRATGADASDHAFRSVDGYSHNDVYAAGWEGEIWRYDGHVWSRCCSPTNLAIHCIRCAGDGQVYAVGQCGSILRGRHERWSVIDHQATEGDLWSCEWFGGRLFVATMRALYELRGDSLVPVQFDAELPPATCHQLSSADGIMWSVGAHDVMQFDGTQWIRIL